MISVRYDNSLTLPSIAIPMFNETKENDPQGNNNQTRQQSKVYGITTPLVYCNRQVLIPEQILSMRLYQQRVPMVDLVIDDASKTLSGLRQPGADNTLQIQIIPEFDEPYHKINLTFYITRARFSNGRYYITGVYNVGSIRSSLLKSYGELTTWELFDTVAKENSLGFCSNIDSSDDKRFIYSNNINPIDLLNREIQYSHGDSDEAVLDWWIDWYNNINLVDIYKEYITIYPDDDLKITVGEGLSHTASDDESAKQEEVIACFTNQPDMYLSQLFIPDLKTEQAAARCSDYALTTFDALNNDSTDTLMMNGDAHDDIFIQAQYGGEYYAGYDYLTCMRKRDFFFDKININTLKIEASQPLFGLMHGGKTNVRWYDINSYMTSADMTKGNTDDETVNNTDNPDADSLVSNENTYIINKQYTGQYYITDEEICYDQRSQWTHKFTLVRDGMISNYLDETEETNA